MTKITVKKITNVNQTDKGYTITQFITDDDQVLQTFSKDIKEGESYEGEIEENKFGKQFKKAQSGQGKFNPRPSSDPDTMLIAYAKDTVTAFIEAGVIKKGEDAIKGLQAYTKAFFALYDERKGKVRVSQLEENQAATAKFNGEVVSDEEEAANLEDIDF